MNSKSWIEMAGESGYIKILGKDSVVFTDVNITTRLVYRDGWVTNVNGEFLWRCRLDLIPEFIIALMALYERNINECSEKDSD